MAKPFRTLVAFLMLCRVRVDGSSMDIKVQSAEGGVDSLVPVASPSSGVVDFSTEVRLRIPSRIEGSPILRGPRPTLYLPSRSLDKWEGELFDSASGSLMYGWLARFVEDNRR